MQNINSGDKQNQSLTIDDGRVALNTDKHGQQTAIITVKGIANRSLKKEIVMQQNLTVSADFVYKVKLADNEKFDEPKFRELIQDYALNFCVIKIQEIVKEVTSLDYGSPFVIHDFDFPSGIKITKEENR
ncbi:hypothetical protein [Limosilactobacillus sp.]|uniref:hypothetical protein n=1 Tax=Limosilactobacillus sp. TaxID=2773925 RepID=UPI00345E43A0